MPFISYRLFGWMPLEINPKKKLRTLNNGTSYLLCSTAFCEKCTLIFCDLRFYLVKVSCSDEVRKLMTRFDNFKILIMISIRISIIEVYNHKMLCTFRTF